VAKLTQALLKITEERNIENAYYNQQIEELENQNKELEKL
jgi:hypothetical protein